MAVYFVLQIRWETEAALHHYAEALSDMIEKHGGRFVVASKDFQPLEGTWKPGRLIVVEFPSMESFRAWYESEEYRPLRAFRLRNSDSDAVVATGL